MHEPLDIEFSILKQRLARRLVAEGQTDDSVGKLDLVELTKVGGGVVCVGYTRVNTCPGAPGKDSYRCLGCASK